MFTVACPTVKMEVPDFWMSIKFPVPDWFMVSDVDVELGDNWTLPFRSM